MDCPHHNIPEWLILHAFYGGLSDNCKKDANLTASRAFMNVTIKEAWDMMDRINSNYEAWELNEGNDYECVESFIKSESFENFSKEYFIDSDVIVNIIKTYYGHIKLPQTNWVEYKEPAKEESPVRVGSTNLAGEILKQEDVVKPRFAKPLPFL